MLSHKAIEIILQIMIALLLRNKNLFVFRPGYHMKKFPGVVLCYLELKVMFCSFVPLSFADYIHCKYQSFSLIQRPISHLSNIKLYTR